jgi:hypothetical protein
MDWVLSFGLALEVYQRAVDQKVWVNKAGKNRIIDHLIHNKGRLPKVVGEKLEIGNVGECQHIHSGNVLQFHKDWQVQFREVKQSLVRPMLDDLYGALGDFNFHFLVNGWVERLAEKKGQAHYEVTITKVGVYIKDSYDFNDDPNSLLSQPLGFWGCNPLYIGTRPGLNRYYVNNADFREWRKKDGRGFGGDFMVFSEIKVLSTNDSFSFP